MSFICHIHNCTEYNSEMCSLHLTIQVHTHLEQWAADTVAPGEQLGVRCLAQWSHLSLGQFLPEPRFEPTTLGNKSDALSDALFIRAKTAPDKNYDEICAMSSFTRRD